MLGVGVGVRALCGSTGPQNLQLALRTGGANYLSGTDFALSTGFQASAYTWTTDPATSASWTAANAQAVEGGMEAFA